MTLSKKSRGTCVGLDLGAVDNGVLMPVLSTVSFFSRTGWTTATGDEETPVEMSVLSLGRSSRKRRL